MTCFDWRITTARKHTQVCSQHQTAAIHIVGLGCFYTSNLAALATTEKICYYIKRKM